jgi:hypothetical protein
MSTFAYSKPGIGNAASFQSSGIPWVSSSVAPASGSVVETFSFPQVTKFVTVKNINVTDEPLRIGFSENGVITSGNYFVLSSGESFTAELKVTDIFLMGDGTASVAFSVVAGLTNIDRRELVNNWSGSVGVG